MRLPSALLLLGIAIAAAAPDLVAADQHKYYRLKWQFDGMPPDPAPPLAGLTLSYGTIPNGVLDEPFFIIPTVTGDQGPLSFSVASGALPAGVWFDTFSGMIVGSPTETGQFDALILVDDTFDTATAAFSVLITGTSTPVTVLLDSIQACSLENPTGARLAPSSAAPALTPGSLRR